jgi:hypothetical protein
MMELFSKDNCFKEDDLSFSSEPDLAYGYTNNANLSDDDDGDDGNNNDDDDKSDVIVSCEIQSALLQQAPSHDKSGCGTVIQDEGVELVKMLKYPGCPLFFFENILEWAGKAQLQNRVDFALLESSSREEKIKDLTSIGLSLKCKILHYLLDRAKLSH